MEKKIKCAAYVVERQMKIFGEKAGLKVGFQPEAAEDETGGFIQVGGVYIETTDKEFFEQGIKYEVEMTIKRKT